MMRSLYSGVSGLKVHQTKMDVIGNNISNVNTVGFKASNVTFADILYQTTQSATGPNEETGRAGQNGMQVGLGAGMAAITAAIGTAGGSQRTDNPFDLSIEGDGFFIVSTGTENYFTKAGSFTIDANGNLCTPAGYTVMGWGVDPSNDTKILADSVRPLQIMGADNMYSNPEPTTKVSFSGNIDSQDTQMATGRATNFTFYDKMGQSYTVKLKVTQDVAAGAVVNNNYKVEVTDVLDANGDSLFVVARADENSPGKMIYEPSPNIKSITFGGITFSLSESQDNPGVNPDDGTVTLTTEGGNVPILSFNAETGKFHSVSGEGENDNNEEEQKTLDFVMNVEGEQAHPFETVSVDFSELTMYANSGKTTLEGQKGGYDGAGRGRAAGSMSGCTVDTTGKIYGIYDNGDQKLLGQVVIANFANVSGLEAIGNSMFAETLNSGEFDGIGEDVSVSGGSLKVGVLEMSNVDLAAQFTDMITTQRGFQANSRIITTSDTMLEELINLTR